MDVSWVILQSPKCFQESDRYEFALELHCPKKPIETGLLRQETFRSGRKAAYQALRLAGFRDRLTEEAATEPGVSSDCIPDKELLRVVGKNPDRSPRWPIGFVGSITHSDHWVVAVAARSSDYQSIGVDTEVIQSESLANQLQHDVGKASEWDLLAEAGMTPAVAFTLLFSAKEAFYKCWYPLKKVFMDHLDVAATDIVPEFNGTGENANYGMIVLESRTGLTHSAAREMDLMQLRIRYCITANDVFTVSNQRK